MDRKVVDGCASELWVNGEVPAVVALPKRSEATAQSGGTRGRDPKYFVFSFCNTCVTMRSLNVNSNWT